jgi:hypothetical protein
MGGRAGPWAGVMRTAATVVLILTGAAPAAARQEPEAAVPGADLTVYHATFGPGEAVWEKFGHNAIWIHDAATGSTTSYNYGIFDFNQQDFIPRLMKGSMLYSMGVRSAEDEVASYSFHNRSIWLQRLSLTPAQSHALREFLEWNWLPENRDYLYDYFRDNCSTRIRDALDGALGGVIETRLAGVPTGTTFRSHSLRLTAESTPTYTGLLLGLGSPTDREIDAWEEGFIPMELMKHLRSVEVMDEAGRVVPLVAEERTLFLADRRPPPDEPPARTHLYLLAGLLIALAVAALAEASRTRRRARLGLALVITLWGVLTGFFGLILALLWTATNHTATHGNLNLLQVNPLGFLLAVAAPLGLLTGSSGRRHAVARLAWPSAIALAALSVTGLVLNAFPAVYQANGPIVALALPLHLAVVLSLYRALPGRVSVKEDMPDPAAAARPA